MNSRNFSKQRKPKLKDHLYTARRMGKSIQICPFFFRRKYQIAIIIFNHFNFLFITLFKQGHEIFLSILDSPYLGMVIVLKQSYHLN